MARSSFTWTGAGKRLMPCQQPPTVSYVVTCIVVSDNLHDIPRCQGLLPLPPATRSQRTLQKPKLSKLSRMAPVSLKKVCTAREYPLSPKCLTFGCVRLYQGDAEAALALYQRSVNIKRTASSLFNLGVAHYHLSTLTFFCISAANLCVPSLITCGS